MYHKIVSFETLLSVVVEVILAQYDSKKTPQIPLSNVIIKCGCPGARIWHMTLFPSCLNHEKCQTFPIMQLSLLLSLLSSFIATVIFMLAKWINTTWFCPCSEATEFPSRLQTSIKWGFLRARCLPETQPCANLGPSRPDLWVPDLMGVPRVSVKALL